MKYSILTAIYNKESFLEKCLESLVHETGDYEIILVDDGSTDQSPLICDRYAEQYPNISVIHQENGGLMSAREAGILAAAGEFLLFCDADDSYEPGFLTAVDQALAGSEAAGKPADICLYGALEIRGPEKKRFPKPPFPEGIYSDKTGLYDALFLTYSVSSVWGKCCRKSLFKSFPFQDFYDCSYGEDFLLSAWIYRNAKNFVYLDKPLYNYRVTGGMMKQYNPSCYLSYKKANAAVSVLLAEEPISGLPVKTAIHLLQAAYGGAIQFRFLAHTDIHELDRLSDDEAFRSAYRTAAAVPLYRDRVNRKERTVLRLLYRKNSSVLALLIAVRRILDRLSGFTSSKGS